MSACGRYDRYDRSRAALSSVRTRSEPTRQCMRLSEGVRPTEHVQLQLVQFDEQSTQFALKFRAGEQQPLHGCAREVDSDSGAARPAILSRCCSTRPAEATTRPANTIATPPATSSAAATSPHGWGRARR